MRSNYIIMVDDDGNTYLAHALPERVNNVKKTAYEGVGRGVRVAHKYIAKIADRYFYSPEELKAYYEAAQKHVQNLKNNSQENLNVAKQYVQNKINTSNSTSKINTGTRSNQEETKGLFNSRKKSSKEVLEDLNLLNEKKDRDTSSTKPKKEKRPEVPVEDLPPEQQRLKMQSRKKNITGSAKEIKVKKTFAQVIGDIDTASDKFGGKTAGGADYKQAKQAGILMSNAQYLDNVRSELKNTEFELARMKEALDANSNPQTREEKIEYKKLKKEYEELEKSYNTAVDTYNGYIEVFNDQIKEYSVLYPNQKLDPQYIDAFNELRDEFSKSKK